MRTPLREENRELARLHRPRLALRLEQRIVLLGVEAIENTWFWFRHANRLATSNRRLDNGINPLHRQ